MDNKMPGQHKEIEASWAPLPYIMAKHNLVLFVLHCELACVFRELTTCFCPLAVCFATVLKCHYKELIYNMVKIGLSYYRWLNYNSDKSHYNVLHLKLKRRWSFGLAIQDVFAVFAVSPHYMSHPFLCGLLECKEACSHQLLMTMWIHLDEYWTDTEHNILTWKPDNAWKYGKGTEPRLSEFITAFWIPVFRSVQNFSWFQILLQIQKVGQVSWNIWVSLAFYAWF